MSLKDLNEQQKQAVTYGQGPLLIVAGAGTGKTTVITERVAWLVGQKKVKTDEVLALTFTDKAAGEMEERIDRLLPYGYTDLWVMTFHSFCERVLQQHGLDIGIPNDFKLLNQTQQWMLVRQNLDKFNLDYYRPLGNPTKFIHALVKHFSRCKDEEIWPEDYLEYAEKLKANLDEMENTQGRLLIKPKAKKQKSKVENQKLKEDEMGLSEIKRLEEVANAYHVYQRLLLENEALDFGDLINYTLKLFRERPHILKKFQNQFKYILVDEFQDTNWAQYELVKLLALPQNNITTVADDDQAIYLWRGASYNNLVRFIEDYPQASQVLLTQNYRSTQNILDLAYKFIQLNNPERLEEKLKAYKPNSQARGLSKKLTAQTGGKGLVEHLHALDMTGEVAAVINKIIDLKNKDNQASWNDFAILVRANNQAEPFLSGLQTAHIPHNFVASKGLYSKEVIMDILAYLKLLDNYHESVAMWRILNLPVVNLKIEDLMRVIQFANRKALSLFEACQQVSFLPNIEEESKRKINKILNLIINHTRLARKESVKRVVLKFLEDFNYQQFLLNKNNENAFIYINQLIKKIDDFENSFEDKSVKNFVSLLDLELESGEQGDLSKETEEGPEAIKVMTVHAAKGLEFKYVFIVNLVDKRFPSINRKDPIELPDELVKEIIPSGDVHLQEERRLFYVAMTRAKQGLFFSSADSYGGSRKKKLSRFLYEIGFEKSEILNSKPKIQNLKQDNNLTIKQFGNKKPPTTFSYSQLKAFETCPYQYYLNFILKVPTHGKGIFSYGKTMHITLQRFFSLIKENASRAQGDLFSKNIQALKQKEALPPEALPPFDVLLGLYQQTWIDDWYEDKGQKEKYKKQGEKSLKEFYKQLKEKGIPRVLELEKGFNFKLNKYTIKGVIDRVDQLENGKVAIVDYKTGSPKTEKTVEKDQLLIYQIAAEEVFGWQVEKLIFHYLDDNSQISFLGSEDGIKKIQEKMISLIEGILSANWTALPSIHCCKYCDFREICGYKT